MIGGSYFVITGQWSWPVVALSVVYALAATTVLFGKHIDKLEEDRSRKIRTLPVLLGERMSRAVAIGLMTAPYILAVVLVVTGRYGPALLLVLLALPKLVQAVRVFAAERPSVPPPEYPESAWPLWYVSFAFVHNRVFGALFLLALLVDGALHRGQLV